MNTLITGGAGFIGSHLADALLEAGHRVRVLDRLDPQVHGNDRKRPAYLSTDVELRVADLCDREAVRDALDGIDAVFHHAAVVGVGQSMYEIERYVAANALGSAVLLEEIIARRESLRKVLVASSMSVYGEGAYTGADGGVVHPELRPEAQVAARRWEVEDAAGAPLAPIPTHESTPLQPHSIYASTKRGQEEMFLSVGRSYDIPTVALRYFNTYGSRQALSNPYTGVLAIFSSQLLNGNRPLVFEDGLQRRDFTHVSDIVRANLLALESQAANGGIYNVGTGRATTVLEIARLLAHQLGVDVAPDVPSLYRAGDVRHCYADIGRIRADLGYEPAVTLGEGLAELLDWVRTQMAEDRVDAARAELTDRGLAR